MTITVGTLGRLLAVEQRAKDIVFSFESSDLVLTPLRSNLIRHTWMPKHWRLYAEPVAGSFAVTRRLWPAGPPAMISEAPDTVQVKCGDLLVEATRNPFHLRYSTVGGDRKSVV